MANGSFDGWPLINIVVKDEVGEVRGRFYAAAKGLVFRTIELAKLAGPCDVVRAKTRVSGGDAREHANVNTATAEHEVLLG